MDQQPKANKDVENQGQWRSNSTISFSCQAIHKKILWRFDTSFDIKMMVKTYAIEIIFKSHDGCQAIKAS